MTKKKLWIAILVAFVVLASSVIYLSRAAIFQRGNPIPYEAKPVFKTENISRITFYKLPDTGKEYEVPSELWLVKKQMKYCHRVQTACL